jgi:hypothetical protein
MVFKPIKQSYARRTGRDSATRDSIRFRIELSKGLFLGRAQNSIPHQISRKGK